MKKIAAMMALGLAMALSAPVIAHESPAKHGGIVKSAGDLSFELVNKDGKVTIHVDDHGEPVATAGATGTLTVLKGTQKSETTLSAGAGNTLVAKDDVKLEAGNKVLARVTLPGKPAVSVRYAIK
ncbi:hypothetical protein [Pseudoduganella albidiflava]|uniref:Uncharacterized protein n=1 Tax=Pseudoduganella albidiflava TaxID=321983 RepID=A0A411WTH2_9BURK|nr:hypothetical protein [Pseudoduganella albidiflava]QBH99973.1 hypothetical protein EYF70_03270 [Pseudoduganella albidiflava]GGY55253.1 hypothetical protein GCM10007387_42210 [Pseudoduganella albidiflava]